MPTMPAHAQKSPAVKGAEPAPDKATQVDVPGVSSVEISPPVSIGGKTGNRKSDGKDKECINCMTGHRKTPLG